jgi:hypothetical protein
MRKNPLCVARHPTRNAAASPEACAAIRGDDTQIQQPLLTVYEAAVRAAILLLVALVTLTVSHPAFADARTEAAAKDALKKAETDYLGMNYGSGAGRLQKALRACGTTKCKAGTRAALLRDIGTMLFRKGDKEGANKSWASASKAQPGIALNPAYDSPDMRSAFEAAVASAAASGGGEGGGGGKGTGGGGGGGGAPPSGDFTHTPAMEQKVNTPLPIYVEGGPDEVASVVVKYKGATMSDWRKVDLDKVSDGWGGLVPCSDVTSGTMRYYIQGLNGKKEPIANSGDAKHPYTVAIKDEISGDEPRLPGMKPPKQCGGASADCPPDFPGCGKGGSGKDKAEGEGEGETTEGEGKDVESHPKRRRIWVGLAGALDFMQLPSGQNVCRLWPLGTADSSLVGQPAKSGNYYCTNLDGSDFPARTPKGANNNSLLHPGTSGNVPNTFVTANLRLLLSFDYALTNNILLGARLGVVFFTYPGGSPSIDQNGSVNAAVNDGRASSYGRLHAELRGTYLFGKDPLAKGFAPMVFVGGGLSEFDAHTSDTVVLYPPGATPQSGKVNIWRTDGPGFFLLGGGARWGITDRLAATFGLRINVAVGGNGVIPTIGPELGTQVGF